MYSYLFLSLYYNYSPFFSAVASGAVPHHGAGAPTSGPAPPPCRLGFPLRRRGYLSLRVHYDGGIFNPLASHLPGLGALSRSPFPGSTSSFTR